MNLYEARNMAKHICDTAEACDKCILAVGGWESPINPDRNDLLTGNSCPEINRVTVNDGKRILFLLGEKEDEEDTQCELNEDLNDCFDM